MTDLPISELRRDPIMGRKVYIAEDRAGRPNDYAELDTKYDRAVTNESVANCPFCEGHERETPPALVETQGEDGHWRVRVIPNKYPAVRLDAAPITNVADNSACGPAEPPLGGHEVIIESPRHLRELTDLSANELAMVIGVYRSRMHHWSQNGRMRHATLLKNVGFSGGASLEHVHSQLMVLPFVPTNVAAELERARGYYQEHRECVFCRLLAEERRREARIVADEGMFIAFCAYAARQPYETWILPTEHAAHFHTLSDDDLLPLAELLQQLLRRLRRHISPSAYNLVLHTSPFDSTDTEAYHWHWELIPRSTQLAGLELGGGVHINPVSPERAACSLRKVAL